MIYRIVKMHFTPEKINEFLEIFETSNQLIRNYQGCKSLILLRDIQNENVFFTISTWENELVLENYRGSALFNETWAKTKILFSEKAVAWSTQIS
ncbi:MAG TPA: antibiotic biosynthesis monooxygenase [Saprospiraceae bacterium]|nr:antibiotic biosynthesis monooxygenase [Saprospirales bacterium]HRQ30235.1 antibiotic biosynthesis monooxygenase [Saprospiraceae bacterium]